eukprot:295427-Rhodomonas_salina.1
MGDFDGVDSEVWDLLVKCREEEAKQIASIRETGEHLEWLSCVKFEVDPEVPHYAKGPYGGVYQSMETVKVACREMVKLMRWLVPIKAVAWIESWSQMVSKPAPGEVDSGGWKHRTVVDQTDSGLNRAVKLWKVGLPTALDIIQRM